MNGSPKIAVLLCTYNGAAHLEEQLTSIFTQDVEDFSIYVSDDGSTDGTVAILRQFANTEPGRVHIQDGPQKGHTANFLSLACDGEIRASYFAFADQDDLWGRDKLSRALSRLSEIPLTTPALYCSRTRSISEDGHPLGLSPLFRRPPDFRNALVQNIGGGNTMVFNNAARELLLQAGMVDVPTHDWWAYLLISGAGGKVIYDPEPSLGYRQHDGNEIGANIGWPDRVRRYWGALMGRNRAWSTQNIRALEQCSHLLQAENRQVLATFREARGQGLIRRMAGIRSAGLYAQTFTGKLGLFVATLLNKI